jgi:hypothetical protein
MILSEDDQVRDQLLKLARDLPVVANARSKPVSAVLAEARAKLQQIEIAAGTDQQPFTRITAEELATGKFDLTYLIDGVLVKDRPAGLVAPKKSLKTNISIDLAIARGHRRPIPGLLPRGRTQADGHLFW